jgi:hypothetical protein
MILPEASLTESKNVATCLMLARLISGRLCGEASLWVSERALAVGMAVNGGGGAGESPSVPRAVFITLRRA